jgi:hypothetical protein
MKQSLTYDWGSERVIVVHKGISMEVFSRAVDITMRPNVQRLIERNFKCHVTFFRLIKFKISIWVCNKTLCHPFKYQRRNDCFFEFKTKLTYIVCLTFWLYLPVDIPMTFNWLLQCYTSGKYVWFILLQGLLKYKCSTWRTRNILMMTFPYINQSESDKIVHYT